MSETQANVVFNFHKGDQSSAARLLELLMCIDEGCEARYYLQYGSEPGTLRHSDVVLRFMSRKAAVFSCDLPRFDVPEPMLALDPNQGPFPGNHTVRTPAQKMAIFQWNLCVLKYLCQLDRFLVIEPDCAVFKHGWLADIYQAAEACRLPFFGHAKRGRIGGRWMPTHFAGCSLYDSSALRPLDLPDRLFERFDNPWWQYRNEPDTTTANNAFYGPVFSGYDISFDYFLFARYWMDRTGQDDPRSWPLEEIEGREDIIFCDFHTKMAAEQILDAFVGRLPLMHGIKDDAVRESLTRRFSQGSSDRRGGPENGHPPDRGYPLSSPISRPARAGERFEIGEQRNRYSKERCWIICNGPSLRDMDLSPLKDEYTIGLNRIYLHYPRMGFEPTFLCCVNSHVLGQFAADFDRLASVKLLSDRGRHLVSNTWNTTFMERVGVHEFVTDLTGHQWCEGWTVTYCALQLAYHLGFETVLIIGADHHFEQNGPANQLVTSAGRDVNHFHPDYFGEGVRWQFPDLERSEISYRNAKSAFEQDGRVVLDATVNGRLTVFQKVDYETALRRPHSVATHISHADKGLECLANGDLQASEAAFRAALALAPDYAAGMALLSTLLWQTGREKEAIGHFTLALRQAPRHRDTVLSCAEMLLEKGRHETASVLCEKYLALTRDNDERVRSVLRRVIRRSNRDNSGVTE